ncbi:MAG TPA: N-acetyltransferase [Victivallales bacterium]|nr:N-acetyltransferase [Victivallales bacterium]
MTPKKKGKIKYSYSIRAAKKKDVAEIEKILLNYAKKNLLLPRSGEEIEKHIASFKVAELAGKLLGCCASRDFGKGLFEIRSLAVLQEHNGKGLGSKLVKACFRTLKKNAAKRIFALTYRPKLFERLGFRVVSKDMFPEKIWSDCAKCRKKNNCDEIAVLIEL